MREVGVLERRREDKMKLPKNDGELTALRGAAYGRAATPATPGQVGPFFRGSPGHCPTCGRPSDVLATGPGGWTEVRLCEAEHEFTVSFQHSNDPGTVTAPPEAVVAAYEPGGAPEWRKRTK